MIEIIFIFFQLFVFLCMFSFPFNPKILNQKLNSRVYNFNIFDTLMLNGVVIFNILLILSFLDLNLIFIFYLLISLSLIFFVFNINSWKYYFKYQKVEIFIFCVMCLVLFLNLAENLKFEWDGIAHWFYKTKSFYEGYGIENIKNLPAPHYPHLGTYVWALFWKNSFVGYEYFGRLIYIFFYILSIFVATNLFKIKSKIFNFLIIILLIIFTYDEFLFGGYQEYFLFSFGIILSKLIINTLNRNPSNFDITMILLTGNLLMWFKDEGLFYFVILIGVFIFYQKIKFNSLILSLFALILIFLQYLTQQYLIEIYALQESINDINFSHFFDLIFLLERVLLISKYLLISIIKYPIWIVFLFSIFVLKILNFNKKVINFYIIKLIIFFNFLYIIYILHPQTSEFLLSVTLDRLLFQISGFFILPIIMFFHYFISDKLNKKII